jgi:hypothetical protein
MVSGSAGRWRQAAAGAVRRRRATSCEPAKENRARRTRARRSAAVRASAWRCILCSTSRRFPRSCALIHSPNDTRTRSRARRSRPRVSSRRARVPRLAISLQPSSSAGIQSNHSSVGRGDSGVRPRDGLSRTIFPGDRGLYRAGGAAACGLGIAGRRSTAGHASNEHSIRSLDL